MLRRAGASRLTLALPAAVALVGCVTVIRGVPRLEVEVQPGRVLVIENGTRDTINVESTTSTDGSVVLRPEESARLGFRVRTIADLDRIEGALLRERPGTRQHEVQPDSVLLIERGLDVVVRVRTMDGTPWEFEFDPASCERETSKTRLFRVEGPPRAGIRLPLCRRD